MLPQVIAVANDITHQSGAFGPREDSLFRAAGELALKERLPLIYLAANSGARVGVATEVWMCHSFFQCTCGSQESQNGAVGMPSVPPCMLAKSG